MSHRAAGAWACEIIVVVPVAFGGTVIQASLGAREQRVDPRTSGSSGVRADPQVLRPDIQALRALAVASVVIFHLWPTALPGGYVGVDVFFVISGFLIGSHLLREVDRTGRIRLATFWAKRAKRLLPAALLVLLVTALATMLVAPSSVWPQYFRQIAASTWYVENWALAADSVDYLAADSPPSPVQHFWSLSVEEQFYVLTPLLLLAALALARSRSVGWRRPVLLTIGGITVASFAWSVWLTATTAPVAYFSTFTRAWEFGLGALLALAPGVPDRRTGRVLAWAGIAGIVTTCLLYSPSVSFPGYAAALPVLSTAAVILGRDLDGRFSVGRLGSARVPAVLGRTSYSIYLWHWPFIVLVPLATGAALTGRTKVAIVALTLVLAYLQTRFVEEPMRFSPRLLGGRRRPRAVAAWSLAAMAVVSAVAFAALAVNTSRDQRVAEATTALVASRPACFGAAAMDPLASGCPDARLDGVLVPDPALAPKDGHNPSTCWAGQADPTLRVCTLGPTTGFSRHLFAVGDSHNNALIPAYEEIARERNWRIDVAGHNGCYWTAAAQVKAVEGFTTACAQWGSQLTDYLATHTDFDAVLTTYALGRSTVSVDPGQSEDAATVRGLHDAWAPVVARGTPVIAIRDVPRMRADVVTCVERFRLEAAHACDSPRAKALADFDGLTGAVATTRGSSLVDLTSFFCTPGACLPVIGHVAVYQDRDHITATYARTLGPYLGALVARHLPA